MFSSFSLLYTTLCLFYKRNMSLMYLEGHLNVDYTKEKVDRKSTSEGGQFIGSYMISWSIKKQNFIALSTKDVEYMVFWQVVDLNSYG